MELFKKLPVACCSLSITHIPISLPCIYICTYVDTYDVPLIIKKSITYIMYRTSHPALPQTFKNVRYHNCTPTWLVLRSSIDSLCINSTSAQAWKAQAPPWPFLFFSPPCAFYIVHTYIHMKVLHHIPAIPARRTAPHTHTHAHRWA
jgi:hypothetical protein